jgi:hypothetical protein
MSSTPIPDEQPKKKVAKRVIAVKRQYFFPAAGVSIEATDMAEAVRLHTKHQRKQQKEVGDA